MFVRKSTYETLREENELLLAQLSNERNTREVLAAEKNKLRQALHAIVKQKTTYANATVTRMARYADMALNGTFGNRKQG